MTLDGSQLITELQSKLRNIEYQLSLLQPIVAQVSELFSSKSHFSSAAAIAQKRVASIYADKESRVETSQSDVYVSSDAVRSIVLSDQLEVAISQSSMSLDVQSDRDEIFEEAENRSKMEMKWTMKRGDKSPSAPASKKGSKRDLRLNRTGSAGKNLAHSRPANNRLDEKQGFNSSPLKGVVEVATPKPSVQQTFEDASPTATQHIDCIDSSDTNSLVARKGSLTSENSFLRFEPTKPKDPSIKIELPKIEACIPSDAIKKFQTTVTILDSKDNSSQRSRNSLQISHAASMARRKSSRSVAYMVAKTTTAKYNSKGSLASIIDTNQNSPKIQIIDTQVNDNPMAIAIQFAVGFNPYSSFNVKLDFVMALIYISVLWIVPLIVAFEIQISDAYSIVLTVMFALDTLIETNTFRSAHPSLSMIKNPTIRDWRFHYFKCNFVSDFVSIMPFELLNIDGKRYLWLIRLIRLYKLPSLMSTSPKFLLIRKWMQNALGVGQTFSNIFPLMFVLCAFLHLQACAIFLFGQLEGFSNTSIAQIQSKSIGDQYTWALFQAVGNTFPMTYKPTSTLEQWIILIFIVTGAGLYTSIVGTISSFAIGMDASGRLYKQKIDELREYMRWKDLNPTTRRKVMKYYEIKYRGKFFEEGTLLSEMNESLQMEIAAHNCRELINKVGFLRREVGDGRDENFVGRIAIVLKACYFVPGDVIISQGDIGLEMFFILSGTVDIIVNGKKVSQFHDGAFFGELALIANIPRTATVQAASSCSIYKLSRSDFMSILSDFDDMRQRIDVIYNERMAKVKQEQEAKALQKSQGP